MSTEHSASNFMLSFPKDRGSEVLRMYLKPGMLIKLQYMSVISWQFLYLGRVFVFMFVTLFVQ